MKLATLLSVTAVAVSHVAAQNKTSDPYEQWEKPQPGHGMSITSGLF